MCWPVDGYIVVAAVGDAGAFRSGRQFTAWLKLVPRQTGTGTGRKVRQLGLSKRADSSRRTLLHGTSIIAKSLRSEWIERLQAALTR